MFENYGDISLRFDYGEIFLVVDNLKKGCGPNS